MEIISFITSHIDELFAIVAAFVAFAATVATMTETKRDDSIIANVQAVVRRVGEYLADRNS